MRAAFPRRERAGFARARRIAREARSATWEGLRLRLGALRKPGNAPGVDFALGCLAMRLHALRLGQTAPRRLGNAPRQLPWGMRAHRPKAQRPKAHRPRAHRPKAPRPKSALGSMKPPWGLENGTWAPKTLENRFWGVENRLRVFKNTENLGKTSKTLNFTNSVPLGGLPRGRTARGRAALGYG